MGCDGWMVRLVGALGSCVLSSGRPGGFCRSGLVWILGGLFGPASWDLGARFVRFCASGLWCFFLACLVRLFMGSGWWAVGG